MGDLLKKLKQSQASASLGDVTREQFDEYARVFGPLENEFLSTIDDPAGLQKELDQTDTHLKQGFDTSRQASEIQRSRYGLSLAPDEAQALQRSESMERALSSTSTKNAVRSDWRDRQLNNLISATGLGRDIATKSTQSASHLAGLEANREAQKAQMKAQERAGYTSLAGTAAGLGLAALIFA